MRRIALLTVAAAVTLGLVVIGSDGPMTAAASHGNVNVHIHDTYFHPAGAFGSPTDHAAAQAACQLATPDAACDAQIHAGDSITWITADPVAQAPHSVTECTDGSFTVCGASVDPGNPIGDTGVLFSNQWPTGAVQFTTPGTYYYRCDVHLTNMRGRVVVAQAPSATPSPTLGVTPSPSGTGATSAAGAASPTVTPARVIGAGGPSDGGGALSWYLLPIGAGLVLLSAAVSVGLTNARRR